MKSSMLLFFSLGFIVSCTKHDPKPNPAPMPVKPTDTTVVKKDTTEDIYIVGTTGTQAGYWKNSLFVPVATGKNAYAADMAFSGNDIYVLGAVNDSIGYWKNGYFNFLAKADTLSSTSIVVSGTDVYCLLQWAGGNWMGFLFKNTTLITKVPTLNELGSTTMYSDGADLYIPGSTDNFPDHAVYWKNGIVNPLPDVNIPGNAYNIALDGTDVYAVGSESDALANTNIATYWKNNVPFYLSDSSSYGKIYFVKVLNGNVYMAGNITQGNQFQRTGIASAIIWKNSIPTNVTPAGYSDQICGFDVSGSDIYVSVISIMTGTSTNISRYYKNGVPVNYTASTQGVGSKIFVRPR